LPVLAQARAQAIRVQCRSNLHQIYTYLTIYASSQHNNAIPLGNVPGSWQAYNGAEYVDQCAFVAQQGPNGIAADWVLLGCLFPANVISASSGPVFYCPANMNIEPYAFNDPLLFNYWPKSLGYCYNIPPGINPAPNGLSELWLGYSVRPVFDNSMQQQKKSNPRFENWAWVPGTTLNSYGYAGMIISAGTTASRQPIAANGLPRIQDLTNKAIVSDLDLGDGYTRQLHVFGSNVLYGDGSAIWVDRSDRDPQTDRDGKTNQTYDYYLLKNPGSVLDVNADFNSEYEAQCWFIFDAAHG